jgi:hypothetical protein
MELRAIGQTKRQISHEDFKNLYKLTIGGGSAFFVATIAFSLLPIAAEFRAALSMSYPSVVAGALIAGLIIGFCVSYLLVRFHDKIPPKNAAAKAVIVSCIALLPAVGMAGLAARGVQADGWHYFLIGAVLNVPRFVALGIAVGYLHTRLCRSARTAQPSSRGDC